MDRLALWFASIALVLATASGIVTIGPVLLNAKEVLFTGRNAESPAESVAIGRVHVGSLRADSQPFPNEMVSLSHNWRLNETGHWSRPEPERPSAALTLESWYRGVAELNLDMAAPSGGPYLGGRAFGFEAQYDGSYASLAIGGDPYADGASGVRLTAGTTSEPMVRLRTGVVADPAPVALSVERADGSSGLVVHGGDRPHIGVALDGWGPARGDSGAVLSFTGRGAGRSIVDFTAVGEEATLLASRPGSARAQPAFSIRADGALQWSDGSPSGSVELERGGPNQLRISGELSASSLVLGETGTRIAVIRVVSLAVPAIIVPRRQSVAHDVRIPDVTSADVLVVNGAAMPAGVVVIGARPAGAGIATVIFANLTDGDLRVEDGAYTFLIVRPS
jgi:hypothetical protein